MRPAPQALDGVPLLTNLSGSQRAMVAKRMWVQKFQPGDRSAPAAPLPPSSAMQNDAQGTALLQLRPASEVGGARCCIAVWTVWTVWTIHHQRLVPLLVVHQDHHARRRRRLLLRGAPAPYSCWGAPSNTMRTTHNTHTRSCVGEPSALQPRSRVVQLTRPRLPQVEAGAVSISRHDEPGADERILSELGAGARSAPPLPLPRTCPPCA